MSIVRYGFVALIAIAMTVGWLYWQGYGISYQNTGSMPKGWYWLLPVPAQIKKGDIIVFRAPPSAEKLALTHHWILPGEVLMKPIVALPGDLACVYDHQVHINHHAIAIQQADYALHHALPQWQFCGTIPSKHYLLLSTYAQRSFDGRYFGLINRNDLIARAIPIGGSL